jgi:hypothetical protein
VRVIVESHVAEALQVLRLSSCGITDAAARFLAASPRLQRLTLLDLSNNPLSDHGGRAFIETPHYRSLRKFICPLSLSPWTQSALDERFHRAK